MQKGEWRTEKKQKSNNNKIKCIGFWMTKTMKNVFGVFFNFISAFGGDGDEEER